MILKLRDGWEEENRSGFRVYVRKGADSLLAYVIVDPEAHIFAYPFGDFGRKWGCSVKTLNEAHAYLLDCGSESPWEVAE